MGTVECLPVVLFLHFHIVKVPETSTRTGWKLFSHIITWRMSIFFPSNKTFGEFDIWGTQREAGAKKPLGNARTSKFTSGLNGPPNGTVAHGAPTVNWNVIEIAAQPSAISQPQQLHFLDKGKKNVTLLSKKKKKNLHYYYYEWGVHATRTQTQSCTQNMSSTERPPSFLWEEEKGGTWSWKKAEKESLRNLGAAGMDGIRVEYIVEGEPEHVRCSGDKNQTEVVLDAEVGGGQEGERRVYLWM